ncbi:MAG TPA: hypothetical protein VJ728_13605, partial [Candidatus Binataceae bacterium]|nr:hypothetical protein [Candidatus Binataceae bacterium]
GPGFAELARLNAEILNHPQNTDLNLRYAALAEKLGEPRLALTAYERILIYDPSNAAALYGIDLVRRGIQPNTTQYVAGVGLIYESNPAYAPSVLAKGEAEQYGFLNVRDERTIGTTRWRTDGNVSGTVHDEQSQLDYGYVGATTGPLWEMLPGLTVHPALGAGASAFDGRFFYGEGIASLGFEAYPNGAYQAVTLRAGLRDYNTHFVPDQTGGFVELVGKFTAPVVVPNLAFSATPWLRWASIEGPLGAVTTATAIQPGDYTEVGGQLNAYVSLNKVFSASSPAPGISPYPTKAPAAPSLQHDFPDVIVGANIVLSERYYRDEAVTGGTAQRRDATAAPGASLILAHLFQYQNTLRLDYSYIHDHSNDSAKSFVDNVAMLTLTRGF